MEDSILEPVDIAVLIFFIFLTLAFAAPKILATGKMITDGENLKDKNTKSTEGRYTMNAGEYDGTYSAAGVVLAVACQDSNMAEPRSIKTGNASVPIPFGRKDLRHDYGMTAWYMLPASTSARFEITYDYALGTDGYITEDTYRVVRKR